jgi:puromycin-sensitive aminopeptidase
VPNDEHDYRLPRTAVPRRYGLTLAPDLEGGTFTGHEDVTIEVLEPTAELVVNAIELEIASVYPTNKWKDVGITEVQFFAG